MKQNGKLEIETVTQAAEDSTTLEHVLERHRGERHIGVLQDYPDPDAISSAFIHKLISAQYDINVDIVYGQQVSHQQTSRSSDCWASL